MKREAYRYNLVSVVVSFKVIEWFDYFRSGLSASIRYLYLLAGRVGTNDV